MKEYRENKNKSIIQSKKEWEKPQIKDLNVSDTLGGVTPPKIETTATSTFQSQ
jgi:hypothetical protein